MRMLAVRYSSAGNWTISSRKGHIQSIYRSTGVSHITEQRSALGGLRVEFKR